MKSSACYQMDLPRHRHDQLLLQTCNQRLKPYKKGEKTTMSHLQYYSYKGKGETNRQNYHYSQAVRVGERIECSGQGDYPIP